MAKLIEQKYMFRHGDKVVYLKINRLTRSYKIKNECNKEVFSFGGRNAENHKIVAGLLEEAIDFADTELNEMNDKY